MSTPIPDDARAALRDHHSLAARVVARRFPGDAGVVLPVTSCVVTKDATTLPRTSVAFTVGDASYAPSALDSLLTPWTTTVDVSAVVGRGPYEWDVPVHDGMILSRVTASRPAPRMTCAADDQGRRLTERQHVAPRTPRADTRTVALIQDYVRRSYPDAAFIVDGVDAADTVGKVTFDGRHADAVRTLAAAVGAEVFPRYDGVWIIRAYPTVEDTTPDLLHVGEDGVLTGTDSELARQYNDVVIRFANPDPKGKDVIGRATATSAPFRPVADGYGYVTFVENRSGKRTQQQADAAAALKLRRLLGRLRRVTLRCPAMPHLEPGDTVEALFANGRRERLVLERCVHDLSPSGQSVLTTRQTSWGIT